MPMGAFELADRVGLDICHHVGKHLSAELGAHQALPTWFDAMVADGLLGEKSGSGFFTWKNGKKGPLNAALAKYVPSAAIPEKETDASLADLPAAMAAADVVDGCLLPMLIEALACLAEEVVADAAQLDAAMIFGIGFPPFRGGLLHAYAGRDMDELTQSITKLGLEVPVNMDVLKAMKTESNP